MFGKCLFEKPNQTWFGLCLCLVFQSMFVFGKHFAKPNMFGLVCLVKILPGDVFGFWTEGGLLVIFLLARNDCLDNTIVQILIFCVDVFCNFWKKPNTTKHVLLGVWLRHQTKHVWFGLFGCWRLTFCTKPKPNTNLFVFVFGKCLVAQPCKF